MSDDDPIRAAFEAWFETSGMLSQIDKFHREPNAPDEYYDPVTQLTWDGYRAGRAAALKEAAALVAAMVISPTGIILCADTIDEAAARIRAMVKP